MRVRLQLHLRPLAPLILRWRIRKLRAEISRRKRRTFYLARQPEMTIVDEWGLVEDNPEWSAWYDAHVVPFHQWEWTQRALIVELQRRIERLRAAAGVLVGEESAA
jgi:hypothetical protein